MHPALATIAMLCILTLSKYLYAEAIGVSNNLKLYLIFITIIGFISYAGYLTTFNRSLLATVIKLRKAED
jgi:hypothetical protein